jgi:diguanylate cyclase (GGDEF)-like protein
MPREFSLKNESHLDRLISDLSLGIYIFDSEGKILEANPVFLNFFRVPSVSSLENQNASELLHLRMLVEDIDLSKEERVIREFEMQIPGVDGAYNVLNVARPYRDVGLGKVLYQGVLLEINDRKTLQSPSPPEGLRDPLTGCFSELYFSEYEKKLQQETWGCVVAYLDHFKQYRDRYGTTLALVATLRMSRFLMRHIRAEDGVVRLTNDQFVVLLDGASLGGAQKVLKRFRSAALGQAPMGFSMGIAARSAEEHLQDTIHRADKDLTPVRVLERTPKRVK